jgi:hypothetical protein
VLGRIDRQPDKRVFCGVVTLSQLARVSELMPALTPVPRRAGGMFEKLRPGEAASSSAKRALKLESASLKTSGTLITVLSE